ncbi:MAG TPA: glycosyltransferase [Anaeromyxobacteraceae bacterium]|nr:glycosyltransferase [Anaeromyxobacteraceae bacterium]
MPGPNITVAICTHNNADMLERALAKLARQRVAPATTWELVVVDNRSTDRTPETLHTWSERGVFPEMRVVREERLGLSNARRAALAVAQADLIAFIDDDCFLHPGWIAEAVAFARSRPRAGAFGGRVRIKWMSPPTQLGRASEWALARQDRGNRQVKLPDRGGVPLVGAGLVVRRDALDESGWIERGRQMGRTGKALTSGDDAEISFRIRAAGWELWYTPTMKIDHVLPAWRSERAYLGRLHRAIGMTLPHIWILGGVYRRTPLSVPFFALVGLARAARKLLSALKYLVLGRMLQAEKRLMAAQQNFGCFLGAFALPPPEEEPPAPPRLLPFAQRAQPRT